MDTREGTQDQMTPSYDAGRRAGFGIAALMLGCVSFLSLLGLEKALLAIVLGGLAMRGAPQGNLAKRLGIAGMILGILFVITLIVVVLVFHDKVMILIRALEDLS